MHTMERKRHLDLDPSVVVEAQQVRTGHCALSMLGWEEVLEVEHAGVCVAIRFAFGVRYYHPQEPVRLRLDPVDF